MFITGSQDIGYSFLCYTVGPCCLSVLTYQFASANPKLQIHFPLTHRPLGTTSLFYLPDSISIS